MPEQQNVEPSSGRTLELQIKENQFSRTYSRDVAELLRDREETTVSENCAMGIDKACRTVERENNHARPAKRRAVIW